MGMGGGAIEAAAALEIDSKRPRSLEFGGSADEDEVDDVGASDDDEDDDDDDGVAEV